MATTYNDTQIAIVDSSGNISVIYPRTKASLVSLTATSYSNVESCLAALGTAAFKNTSNTYTSTGTTVATTKAVYDSYTTLNTNKAPKFKTGSITGTTKANGYLESSVGINARFIVSATDATGQGYIIVPCRVSSAWWFYVGGNLGGYTRPTAGNGQVAISIDYYYYDL